MKRSFATMVVAVLMQVLLTGAAWAQERGSAEEAKALVQKGVAHVKAVGPAKAFEDFSAKDGKWQNKDLYIFALSFEGETLAHGFNKGLIGKNMIELKDPNGKAFIRDMIDVAKGKGSGWTEYLFTNPATKKVEPKSTYTERIPGFDGAIGVGIYKG